MTSERKIAANQRNARRSSGPRTVQGKLRVSRNALRHGLASVTTRAQVIAGELDRLTTAIAGENADAAQREQALIIAESELILMRARAARVDVIEQMAPITATQKPDGPRSTPVSPHEAGNDLSCLKQLMTLDGYERRALSRRKRALRSLFRTTAQ